MHGAGGSYITVQQEREYVYAALHSAASFHCLVEDWKSCEELKPKLKEIWVFPNQKDEKEQHRTEWCAAANKYRCMRFGKSSRNIKMQRTCAGPKGCERTPNTSGKLRVKKHLGVHDMVRRADRNGESFIWCRKCAGYARQKNDESVQAGENGFERKWEKCTDESQHSKRRRSLSRLREDGKVEGQKEGLPGRNIKDWEESSGMEVSWSNKDYGILPRRDCWKMEEFYRKKMKSAAGT